MAVTLTMDWYLSKAEEGKPQTFSNHKHLIFFPINGLINLIAILGDKIFGDKERSPSNYCWFAIKQD